MDIKDKKTSKEASAIFSSIIAASVKGNPKPKVKIKEGGESLNVDEMNLPIKLKNILKGNNINTLKDLVDYDIIDLLKLKNVGVNSISLLEREVGSYGLRLGTKE